jgi:hypothetical protein
VSADDDLIRIDAGGWGLTWAADHNGVLRQVGLGSSGHEATLDVDAVWYPAAFPAFGSGDPFQPVPLRITHHDGMLTTRLVVAEVLFVDEDGEPVDCDYQPKDGETVYHRDSQSWRIAANHGGPGAAEGLIDDDDAPAKVVAALRADEE